MDTEMVKIKITFPMRYGTPNHNGTVYTKEAIESAFGSSNPHMPILLRGDTVRDDAIAYFDERCIGFTDKTYYFDWDEKNHVCNVTLDGHVYDMGADIKINEIHDDKITDFEINSISILK